MEEEKEKYKAKFDIYTKFKQDCFEPCENAVRPISKKEYRSLYKKWCSDNNYGQPSPEDLEEVYNDKEFKKNKNGHIINIKCKNEEDERQ